MMRRLLRTLVICLPFVLSSAAASGEDTERAEATDKSSQAQTADQERTPGESTDLDAQKSKATVLYVPPRLGHLRKSSIRGGGVRSANLQLPEPLVLAPRDHFGLTTSSAPHLFWHLDGPPPSDARIEFLLIGVGAIDPLLETTLPTPEGAGIQRIDLSAHGVRLDPTEAYQWAVTLVPNIENRSLDRISMGGIARRSLPARDSSPKGLAADGLWYDALSEIARQIETDPENLLLQEMQESLLTQEGLQKAVSTYR